MEPSGPTIKDYLNRPRPSWEEIKSKIAEKEKTSKALEEWENNMQKDWRAELDVYREKMQRRRAKDKKEKKKRKREKVRGKNKKNLSTS